jgi:hypothetical protein
MCPHPSVVRILFIRIVNVFRRYEFEPELVQPASIVAAIHSSRILPSEKCKILVPGTSPLSACGWMPARTGIRRGNRPSGCDSIRNEDTWGRDGGADKAENSKFAKELVLLRVRR